MSYEEKLAIVIGAGYTVSGGKAYNLVPSRMSGQIVRLYPGLDERRAFKSTHGFEVDPRDWKENEPHGLTSGGQWGIVSHVQHHQPKRPAGHPLPHQRH